MIGLIYQYTFYTKKQFFFSLVLCLLLCVLILLVYDDSSYYDQYMYQDDLTVYYHQSTQRLYLWILPFLYQMLLSDHDQLYMKPFLAYFGKTIVLTYKLVFYILVITWLTFVFFSVYHLIPYFFTKYYIIKDLHVLFFLNLYLDGIILLIFTFLIVRMKYQSFAYVIPLFYMLYAFLLEDSKMRMFYLVLPIYLPIESYFSLELYYKICYIFTGFILIYIQSTKNNA